MKFAYLKLKSDEMSIKVQYTPELAAAFQAGAGRVELTRIKSNGDTCTIYVDMAVAEKLEVPNLPDVSI